MSSNSKQKTYEQILSVRQISSLEDLSQPPSDKHLDTPFNYLVIFLYRYYLKITLNLALRIRFVSLLKATMEGSCPLVFSVLNCL